MQLEAGFYEQALFEQDFVCIASIGRQLPISCPRGHGPAFVRVPFGSSKVEVAAKLPP